MDVKVDKNVNRAPNSVLPWASRHRIGGELTMMLHIKASYIQYAYLRLEQRLGMETLSIQATQLAWKLEDP